MQKEGLGCCSWGSFKTINWMRVFKILIIIGVVACIMLAGLAAVGVKLALKGGRYLSNQAGQSNYGYVQNGQGYGMMNKFFGSDENVGQGVNSGYGMMNYAIRGERVRRVAGNITKVEGAKITLMDNGAQEQTIETSSNTIITTDNGEVGLSALKAGQFITAAVSTQGGKTVATQIDISSTQ